MHWYRQAGNFTTTNPQGQSIAFDTVYIHAESTEDAQNQIRTALEDETGIFHVTCYPNTLEAQTYHIIADTVDRAEGWAKVLYRLEDQAKEDPS